MWGIAASFALPLLPEVASSADGGVPLVVSEPEGEAAQTYSALAEAVEAEVTALETFVLPALLYQSDENKVLIAMPDGSMSSISPIELRRCCRSPSNEPDSVPADLAPLDTVPMGAAPALEPALPAPLGRAVMRSSPRRAAPSHAIRPSRTQATMP